MNLSFLSFREELFQQGLFNMDSVRLLYPGFNTDNLVNWQKKGHLIKLRNGWYCFKEFLSISDSHFLIANNIYQPSYVSHQEALSYYGLIPEHIIDSISVTTKKTQIFNVCGRDFKYYSIKNSYFFGYTLKNITINNEIRNFLIADKEKAILDLLYVYDFYRTEQDIEEIRFNEVVLKNDVDWNKIDEYLGRFGLKILEKKIAIIRKLYDL